MIGLAQTVCVFDLLRFIGGWRSHYIGLAQGVRIFNLVTVHRELTFSLRLAWFRPYVISISYGSSALTVSPHWSGSGSTWSQFVTVHRCWPSSYNSPGSDSTWFQFVTVHRRLTFPLRFAWLRQYVISIWLRFLSGWHSHYIGLTQGVCDINLLRFIDGWYSHYELTWLRQYVISISYCSSPFSLQLNWLSSYVISNFYGLLVADILTTIGLVQEVRDFNFLRFHQRLTSPLRLAWIREYVISISHVFICGLHFHYDLPGSDGTWFQFFIWIIGNWHSHDSPGSVRTWFQFLTVHRRWRSHYDWRCPGCTCFQFITVHRRLKFIAQIVSNIPTVNWILSFSLPPFATIFEDRESLLFRTAYRDECPLSCTSTI